MDLRVEPGKPPLTVNADAGKASNLDADELDGLDSSELKIGCPSGTTLFGGACIETAPRPATNTTFRNASSDCADEGRRLPTAAELEAFRQQSDITLGSGGMGRVGR